MRYRLIERTGLANSPTFSSRMFVDFAECLCQSLKIAGDFLIEDQSGQPVTYRIAGSSPA